MSQTTCVDTVQQNGIDEKKNRHLIEHSLLFSRGVPKHF